MGRLSPRVRLMRYTLRPDSHAVVALAPCLGATSSGPSPSYGRRGTRSALVARSYTDRYACPARKECEGVVSTTSSGLVLATRTLAAEALARSAPTLNV